MKRRWPGDPGAPGGRPNRVGFAYEAYLPDDIAPWEPGCPRRWRRTRREPERLRDLERLAPRLGALAWPLLRAEAIASSRIEGLAVGHHRLALAEDPHRDDPLARSVLANLEALRRALDLSDAPVTTATLLAVHRALLGGAPASGIAGRIRTSQNWIGGASRQPARCGLRASARG